MKIAIVSSSVMGQTDQLISDTTAALEAEGVRLSGVVKVMHAEPVGDHHCDMDLRILPNGGTVRITQSLGEGSSGCRLNPAAIAEAVAASERVGTDNIDMFILNKFGPQESAGRGFCDAIAAALESGTPVLVGVGGSCREALDTFVDGLAEALPPEPDAIQEWCWAAISKI